MSTDARTDEKIVRALDDVAKAMEKMTASNDALNQSVANRFDAGLKPIHQAIRTITLVPLALIFSGMATALFFMGKISESTWFWVFVMFATPFFGEGIKSVLSVMVGLKNGDKTASMLMMFAMVGAGVMATGGMLTGCQGLGINQQRGEQPIVRPWVQAGEGGTAIKIDTQGVNVSGAYRGNPGGGIIPGWNGKPDNVGGGVEVSIPVW